MEKAKVKVDIWLYLFFNGGMDTFPNRTRNLNLLLTKNP